MMVEMDDLTELKKVNSLRWSRMTLQRNFTSVARALVDRSAKARYQTVEHVTGVPWFTIAVIHERESSQNWRSSLAQGDPWNQVSSHVPAGRGPFNSWEDAAIDALINCPPFAARNSDWTAGGTLTLLERYNGLGYFARGLPSPYIWSGTDQYKSGKFVRDGVFDANAVDFQLGCAGLLRAMMQFDASIAFAASPAAGGVLPMPPSKPAKPSEPSVTKPAAGSGPFDMRRERF